MRFAITGTDARFPPLRKLLLADGHEITDPASADMIISPPWDPSARYARREEYQIAIARLTAEGAIALLESAGYAFDENGMLSPETPISFEYLTNESSGHIAIAECVQQDLAMIGIDMTIRTCDWNVFLNDRKAGNYDIARNGWVADFNDPINMLEMWTTDSGNNDVQFGR